MPKGEQRGNREIKKPKASKKPVSQADGGRSIVSQAKPASPDAKKAR